MKRLTLALFALALVAATLGGAVAGGITQVPHENPSTAKTDFNLAVPLLHYSEIFNQVANREYSSARELIQQLELDYAFLPEEITFIMSRFSDLSAELTDLLDGLESTLDSCEQHLSQNRIEEAFLEIEEARGLIAEAGMLLGNISLAAEELFLVLAPFVSPQDLAAVDEARGRLQNAMERLRELEDRYRDRLESLEDEAREEEDLLATRLTLNIEPAQAWVGDTVVLSGILTAADTPVGSRDIAIDVRGKHFATVSTGEDGSYQSSFVLPYRYIPEIGVQSFYLPQGDDKSSFRACSSTIGKIDVLFHSTSLEVEAPGTVYPGLPAAIAGEVVSQGSTAGRSVSLLLDAKPFLETATDADGLFQHQAVVASETRVGEHKLSISVAPDNKSRSAGRSTDKALNVAKVTPQMSIQPPGFIVLPQEIVLTGKVFPPISLQTRVELSGELRSPLPLKGAGLTAKMGGASTTDSTNEASFDLGLNLPFGFDVVGSEEITVGLAPSEPWHLPARQTASIFVINLVYLAIALAALILAVMMVPAKLLARLRKRKAPISSPGELKTPVDVTEPYLPEIEPEPGDTRGIILQAYYISAAGVQRLARVLLRPQMTLREFLSQVTPSLHRFAELFLRLTSVAEEALYSRHTLGTSEASLARALASQIKEGWSMISHRR